MYEIFTVPSCNLKGGVNVTYICYMYVIYYYINIKYIMLFLYFIYIYIIFIFIFVSSNSSCFHISNIKTLVQYGYAIMTSMFSCRHANVAIRLKCLQGDVNIFAECIHSQLHLQVGRFHAVGSVSRTLKSSAQKPINTSTLLLSDLASDGAWDRLPLQGQYLSRCGNKLEYMTGKVLVEGNPLTGIILVVHDEINIYPAALS